MAYYNVPGNINWNNSISMAISLWTTEEEEGIVSLSQLV
jgi:hypothetical protein